MSAENDRILGLLEQGETDAKAALLALKDRWASEDRARMADRGFILAAHEQGAKDRDAKRIELGGVSLQVREAAAKADAEAEAAAKTEAEAAAAKADAAEPNPAQ